MPLIRKTPAKEPPALPVRPTAPPLPGAVLLPAPVDPEEGRRRRGEQDARARLGRWTEKIGLPLDPSAVDFLSQRAGARDRILPFGQVDPAQLEEDAEEERLATLEQNRQR